MTTRFRSDIASQIKEQLTTGEVARHYGFLPNRSGFVRCPFHREKTASLKFYPGGRGWYCFGCHEGGNVINLVMHLYDIGFGQACLKLSSDFGLGLYREDTGQAAHKTVLNRWQKEQEERQRLEDECQAIATDHRYFWQVSVHFRPENKDREIGYIHPAYAEAVKKLPVLEHRLSELEEKLKR